MTISKTTTLLLLALVRVQAWLPPVHPRLAVTRWAAGGGTTDKEIEMDEHPCWEDLYDDDCVMENAAAAGFVAAKWIKSMPCGEGLQDCDMPDDLTAPETRPEAGIDHVDVMEMLGLKRAKSVKEAVDDDKPKP